MVHLFYYSNQGGYIMLLKQCPRCKKWIEYGHTYCSVCTPIVEAEREERIRVSKLKNNRDYNKKRDPKYLRFYNSVEWKALSRKYIQDRHYRCEKCGALASEVHHKNPIQTEEGWIDRLSYNNLECLCLECHNKSHNRFQKRG